MKKPKIQQELEEGLKKLILKDPRNDQALNIHASDIFSVCPRRHQLYAVYNLNTPPNGDGLAEAVTYGIGIMIQDLISHAFEEIYDTAEIISELKLAVDFGSFAVTGSVDLVVSTKMLEVKSISATAFTALEEPILKHVYQLRTYQWLAKYIKKLKKHPLSHFLHQLDLDTDLSYIVYISKGHCHQPIKVYEVKPDKVFDKTMETLIKKLKAFSKTKQLEPRTCTTPVHLMAKSCPIKEFCFKEGA